MGQIHIVPLLFFKTINSEINCNVPRAFYTSFVYQTVAQ